MTLDPSLEAHVNAPTRDDTKGFGRGLMAAWAVGLLLIGRWLLGLSLRHLEIQGG